MTHIVHTTINSIEFERRILNQAQSAAAAGHRVSIFCLTRPGESVPDWKDIEIIPLMTRFWKGGPLKFLIFNIRLIFQLNRAGSDILHCHDLWPLPACGLISRIRGKQLIYDAHEYYAGLMIFRNRPVRRVLWMWIERIFIRAAAAVVTVSEPIGRLYRERYHLNRPVRIIRNLPLFEKARPEAYPDIFPEGSGVRLLFIGHFKPGRGLVPLLHAMVKLKDVSLVMIGGGELEPAISRIIRDHDLAGRVRIAGYHPTDILISLAGQADIGVVLFEPCSRNYAYALPNKFFEYLMAGLPVLAGDIETLRSYIDKYGVGKVVDPSDPDAISNALSEMISDHEQLKIWKRNSLSAAKELNWEREAPRLLSLYKP